MITLALVLLLLGFISMVIFVCCYIQKKTNCLMNNLLNECKNGSICLPFGSNYECKCKNEGHSGKHCEHCKLKSIF